MHHCLEIQEVLRQIFEALYDVSPIRKGVSTLVSLAVTCQAFRDAALDTLWCTQTNFVNLIKCLPPTVWEENPQNGFDRTFKIRRVPSPAEFIRFDYYARRVKRLEYIPHPWHANHLTDIVLEALVVLWKYRGMQPMLPNLSYIQFDFETHSWFNPRVILNNNLRCLRLPMVFRTPTQTLKSLVVPITEYSPGIKELIVVPRNPVESTLSADSFKLSDIVCRLSYLTRLSCGFLALTPAAIRHLALSQDLEHLQLGNEVEDIVTSLPGNQRCFCALKHLSVRSLSVQPITTLLERLAPSHLRSLVVQCEDPVFDPTNLIQVITHWSTGDFQSIRLDGIPTSTPTINVGILLDNAVLSLLYPFKNMTRVELNTFCSYQLDNDDLQNMAKAWPCLQRLQIGSTLGWKIASGITLEGLIPLFTNCPNLDSLVITIDATSPPNERVLGHDGVSKKITYLQLGDSSIDDAQAVASFLYKLLPNLKGIGGAWLFRKAEYFTYEELRHHQLWQDVSRLLESRRKGKK